MESRHSGGYEDAMILRYHHNQIDFGGGANVTRLIPVPKLKSRGMAGRVLAVEIVNVTEDFAGSSQDGGVRIGDGSDDDKYFDTGLVLDETVDIGEVLHLDHDNASTREDIERGRSSVTMTCIQTTGTPTGIADVCPIIAWW